MTEERSKMHAQRASNFNHSTTGPSSPEKTKQCQPLDTVLKSLELPAMRFTLSSLLPPLLLLTNWPTNGHTLHPVLSIQLLPGPSPLLLGSPVIFSRPTSEYVPVKQSNSAITEFSDKVQSNTLQATRMILDWCGFQKKEEFEHGGHLLHDWFVGLPKLSDQLQRDPPD